MPLAQRLFRFIPRDDWYGFRVLVFLVSGVVFVVASTGVLSGKLFATPTTTKYLTTVVAAAILMLISTLRAPLRPVVFIAVLTVPLGFVFSFSGLQPSPLIAVDLVAVVLALPRRVVSTARLVPMSGAYALFMLPAIVGSNDPGYYAVWLGVTLATGWLTYLVARESSGPQLVVIALTLVALAEGALAIWEFKSGKQINLYGASLSAKTASNYYFSYGNFFRPDATLPDPIALGQVLCLCLPIAIALSASLTRRWTALLIAAATGIAALGLVLSLDRASTIGGAAGLLLTLVLLPRGLRARSAVYMAVVLVLVVLLALAIAPQALSNRLTSIFHPTSAHVVTSQGDLLRLRQWHASLRTFEANPVTGVGFGNIANWLPRYGAEVNSGGQAQSVWLQILAEGGVLGLLAIVGVVIAAIRDLYVSFSRHRVLVAGLSGALLASVVAWTTDWELRYESVAAMLAVVFGLIAALVDSPETNPTKATVRSANEP